MKNCPFCGSQIEDGDHFCKNCGKEINVTSNEQSDFNEDSQSPEISQENSAKKKLFVALFFIALIILGMGWWSWKSSQEDSINGDSNANTEVVNSSSKDVTVTKEVIIKRLEEIFDNVVKGKAQDCDERYFSSDFRRIYKKVEDLDNRINQGEVGFWDSGFWDMSQDCNGMRIVVNDVYDVKDNEAIAKVTFTIKYDDTSKNHNEEIKVILEDGKWVLDDVHGYKKRMKDYYEDNKDSQPSTNQSDLDWLQGHWVYDILNGGGYHQGRIHVEINGDRIIQYRKSRSESKNPTYTIEDDKIKAFFYNDMQTEYPLDRVNHRIDLGDGHWMYKLGSDKDYQRARGFTSEISIFKKLENKIFIRNDCFKEEDKEVESIKFDGDGKLYINGKYEGTVSVDEYTLEEAKLSFKGKGDFSNTEIKVDTQKDIIWLFRLTMSAHKHYYTFKLSESDRDALIEELTSE